MRSFVTLILALLISLVSADTSATLSKYFPSDAKIGITKEQLLSLRPDIAESAYPVFPYPSDSSGNDLIERLSASEFLVYLIRNDHLHGIAYSSYYSTNSASKLNNLKELLHTHGHIVKTAHVARIGQGLHYYTSETTLWNITNYGDIYLLNSQDELSLIMLDPNMLDPSSLFIHTNSTSELQEKLNRQATRIHEVVNRLSIKTNTIVESVLDNNSPDNDPIVRGINEPNDLHIDASNYSTKDYAQSVSIILLLILCLIFVLRTWLFLHLRIFVVGLVAILSALLIFTIMWHFWCSGKIVANSRNPNGSQSVLIRSIPSQQNPAWMFIPHYSRYYRAEYYSDSDLFALRTNFFSSDSYIADDINISWHSNAVARVYFDGIVGLTFNPREWRSGDD